MTYHSAEEIVSDLRSRVNYDTRQADIARQLKIATSYICELLAGKKQPGPDVLKALGYDPKPYYRKAKK